MVSRVEIITKFGEITFSMKQKNSRSKMAAPMAKRLGTSSRSPAFRRQTSALRFGDKKVPPPTNIKNKTYQTNTHKNMSKGVK